VFLIALETICGLYLTIGSILGVAQCVAKKIFGRALPNNEKFERTIRIIGTHQAIKAINKLSTSN
jgi:hypothetical protein